MRRTTVPSASTASRPPIRARTVPWRSARMPPASQAARPPSVALSRAPKSTPASSPAARACAWSAASVTPAPALTWSERAVDLAEVREPREREHDLRPPARRPRHAGAHHAGVAALRHHGRAVLASHAASTAATSSVVPGRTTAAARPDQRRIQSVSYGARTSSSTSTCAAPTTGVRACNRASAVTCGMLLGMSHETVFTLEATPIKFGPGAAADAGWELEAARGAAGAARHRPGRRRHRPSPTACAQAIEAEGIEVVVYDRARVEPTIDSLQHAADAALEAGVDGFVSVGGGSAIDTAKVADLIVTHPAPVMDYVNPPIGEGRKPPGPLKPHLAIPTTSGTGSEATTVAVLDIPDLKVKTGISHRYMRPQQAIVDPELARTLPPEVTASAGLDVVCHAAESYISKPFDSRPRPGEPRRPPALPGLQPGRRRVVGEGAGVRRRLPAPRRRGPRRRRGARPDDARRLDGGGRLRLGGRAHPARLRVSDRGAQARLPAAGLSRRPPVRPARALGDRHRARPPSASPTTPTRSATTASPSCCTASRSPTPGRTRCPEVLRTLMRDVGAPSGIAELGYTEDDVPALAEGAMKQERLLVIAPKDAGLQDLTLILRASL